MKFSLLFALLAALFASSCTDEEPPQRVRHPVARYPAQGREESAVTQQPFNPNAPPPDNAAREETSAAPAPSAAPGKIAKGDFPYGIPVPGKPGFVKSPYAPDQGLVDVRGFPPGQEVKDPYTQKIFLVP